LKQTLARHWRSFIGAAIALDVAIVAVPHITGDFTDAMPLFPIRWLVMAGGVFALRWAQQSGAISGLTNGWVTTYLIFGFTTAGLIGGAFSGFPA
jgi:hypothetical protein